MIPAGGIAAYHVAAGLAASPTDWDRSDGAVGDTDALPAANGSVYPDRLCLAGACSCASGACFSKTSLGVKVTKVPPIITKPANGASGLSVIPARSGACRTMLEGGAIIITQTRWGAADRAEWDRGAGMNGG